MVLSYKQLFLIDASGAVLSALLLGFILPRSSSTFGIPQNILYTLTASACLLAVYSFANYLFVSEKWRLQLKIIATLNGLYCCFTIGSIVYIYQAITFWGLAYFMAELCVVAILVTLELKTAYQPGQVISR